MFPNSSPTLPASLDGQTGAVTDRAEGRPLREADAIEIWIARWLRVPVKELSARMVCDSRRLYAVWWGERFPASRAKAEAEFRRRFPGLADRTSYGYRRIPRVAPQDGQMGLFE